MTIVEKISRTNVEPVSLADAKSHIRVDFSDDDALIEALIASARDYVEQSTGLSLIETRWLARWDSFPGSGPLALPRRPLLQNATGITNPVVRYWSGYENPVLVTIEQEDQIKVFNGNPPTVQLWNLTVWPVINTWRPMPVEVEFSAGFGLTSASVPAPLRQAILLLVGHWYANREAASQDAGVPAPFAVDAILRLYSSGEVI